MGANTRCVRRAADNGRASSQTFRGSDVALCVGRAGAGKNSFHRESSSVARAISAYRCVSGCDSGLGAACRAAPSCTLASLARGGSPPKASQTARASAPAMAAPPATPAVAAPAFCRCGQCGVFDPPVCCRDAPWSQGGGCLALDARFARYMADREALLQRGRQACTACRCARCGARVASVR